MTLEEIAGIDREVLFPAEVALILQSDPKKIRLQVKEDKEKGINSFPFPTIRIQTRTQIPKRPFLKAMGYEEPKETKS